MGAGPGGAGAPGWAGVLLVTMVNNEGGCGAGADSAAPGGGGAETLHVGPRGSTAGWGPGVGSDVAASSTSAGGVQWLPHLWLVRLHLQPHGSPCPAGPGQRWRGHVALGPAAAGF